MLVFDADARHLRAVHIEDGGPAPVEVPAEATVLVPRASEPVRLDLSAEPDADVSPAPTRAVPRSLASAEGGTVDEEITLTIPHRPASVGLRIDGQADGLEVTVRTSEGPVLRQTNETTEDGRPGEVRLEPANLANGTYRVSVHADRLDGRLALVTRTLTGAERLQTLEAPDPQVDRMGALVARIQEGQAWQIPTASADELTLALERGAWADVRVYGPRDRVVQQLQVGQDGPSWRWGSNGSRGPGYDAVQVGVPGPAYTVFVDRIDADVDRVVYALLPDDGDAQPGRPAAIESRVVEVPHSPTGSSQGETIHYAGGLVDVRVVGGDGPAVDRRVTVDSPRGIVLDRRDQAAADDASLLTDRVKHVERFGSGPLEVAIEADAAAGSVRLALEHYVP